MKPSLIDYDLAHAIGQDAGNRSMQAGGRTAWNEDDWNAAAEAMNAVLEGARTNGQPH